MDDTPETVAAKAKQARKVMTMAFKILSKTEQKKVNCPFCGAAPGQDHDPQCGLKLKDSETYREQMKDAVRNGDT